MCEFRALSATYIALPLNIYTCDTMSQGEGELVKFDTVW